MLSLVEIGLQVLEIKKSLKCHHYVFTISLLSPLGKGCDPSFDELESPWSKNALRQAKNWTSGSEEIDENVNLHTNGQMDNRRSEKPLILETITVNLSDKFWRKSYR